MLYKLLCFILTVIALVITDDIYFSLAGTSLSYLSSAIMALCYYPLIWGIINFFIARQVPLWKLLIPLGFILSSAINIVIFTNIPLDEPNQNNYETAAANNISEEVVNIIYSEVTFKNDYGIDFTLKLSQNGELLDQILLKSNEDVTWKLPDNLYLVEVFLPSEVAPQTPKSAGNIVFDVNYEDIGNTYTNLSTFISDYEIYKITGDFAPKLQ